MLIIFFGQAWKKKVFFYSRELKTGQNICRVPHESSVLLETKYILCAYLLKVNV